MRVSFGISLTGLHVTLSWHIIKQTSKEYIASTVTEQVETRLHLNVNRLHLHETQLKQQATRSAHCTNRKIVRVP